MASRIPFFLISLLLLVSASASAQVYSFLHLPASPRSAALGGAPVSVPDATISMVNSNPAYLNRSHHRQVATNIGRQVGDITLGFVSFAYDAPNIGTFGTSIRYAGYGTLTNRDAAGTANGTFNAYDLASTILFSTDIGPSLRYGLSLDFLLSDYHHTSSTAWAVSAGLLYSLPEDNGTIGLSILNAGRQFKFFNDLEEDLPLDIRLGYSRKLQYLPLRLNFTAHHLHEWELSTIQDVEKPTFAQNAMRHLEIGGEFLFSDAFHLRIGYHHLRHEQLKTTNRIDLSGVGIGVGLRLKGIRIDMSRTSQSVVGPLVHIGSILHF